MFVDGFRHLEHINSRLAKNLLQLVVSFDFALILWILKIVLLDVRPNLLHDFGSGDRLVSAQNGGEIGRWFNGLLESIVCLLSSLRHRVLPVLVVNKPYYCGTLNSAAK
jgi:hypothetical protein